MNKLFFYPLLMGGTIILFSCSDKEYTLEVKPPFEKVAVAFDQFEIDASEEKLIRLENGTSIHVPKNAFVDKNGNPVTGKVKLEYREFNDAADIIASGIPMIYEDEEGNKQQMESAGMFELNGKAGNEEVFLAKDKKVQVNMASPVKGDYDFFYLEEEGEEYSDEASLIPSAYGQSDQDEKKKVRWVKLTNNVEEKKKENEPEGPSFKLLVDTTKYPEVKALKDINWKLAVNKEEFNPTTEKNKWVLEEKWQRIEVNPAGRLVKVNNVVDMGEKAGRHFYQFKDSTEILLIGKTMETYTMSGEKVASYADVTNYYFEGLHTFMQDRRIFGRNEKEEILMFDRKGKLIKNFGKGRIYGELDKSRILFSDYDGGYSIAHSQPKVFTISIYDLNGNKLKDIQATGQLSPDGNPVWSIVFDVDISEDRSNFSILSSEGVRVFDSDGKILATAPAKSYRYIEFAEHNNELVLYNYNKSLEIWDWKSDRKIALPEEIGVKEDLGYWNLFQIHSEKPLMIIDKLKDSKTYLYNWKTGKIIELKSEEIIEEEAAMVEWRYTYFWGNDLICKNKNKKITFWDLNGKKIFSDSGHIYSYKEKYLFHSTKDKLVYIDSTGKFIKDFKKMDTAIQFVYPNNYNNLLVSSSRNGEVKFWNMKGDFIKSLFLNTPADAVHLVDNFLLSISPDNNFLLWDTSGYLIYKKPLSRFIFDFAVKDQKVVIRNDNLTLFLESLPEKAPSGSYQLQLFNQNQSFITYVYLNDEDLKKFEEFEKLRKKGIQIESDRKEKETALIRSFEISKFGIYNWDRFYKDENVLQVEADFDFGNAVSERNNVSVFLIAGQDQNTIIRYPETDWSKFSFDPTVPNQLIAVLPEDRIAVFTPEEFKKLNIEAIRNDKKHTFKMKVLDKVSSLQELSRILKTPS